LTGRLSASSLDRVEGGQDNMDSSAGKASRRHRGPSALIRRLLQRVTRSAPAASEGAGEETPEDLPPPGSRSGKGAASVEPYLNQTRNTRPGPLE
jgi:hypothetical protein